MIWIISPKELFQVTRHGIGALNLQASTYKNGNHGCVKKLQNRVLGTNDPEGDRELQVCLSSSAIKFNLFFYNSPLCVTCGHERGGLL